MTSRDLLRLVFRRWYLMLLGALLTVGALYSVARQPGVYFTSYDVVLLPPSSKLSPNTIEDPRYGITPMAGLIVADYNAGHRQTLLGSPDTTLYGEGIRSGSRVRMPNRGSQWQPLYTTPNIDVQVVGATSGEVAVEAKRIGAQLTRLVEERQDELGVKQSMRMTTLVSAPDPVIAYVGGSRARVALGIGIVGITSSTVAVVALERWWVRRSRRDRFEAMPSRAD